LVHRRQLDRLIRRDFDLPTLRLHLRFAFGGDEFHGDAVGQSVSVCLSAALTVKQI
jgi:hypothetical protein